MNGALVHWWAWPREIVLNSSICPPSPQGQQQTAKAVVLAAEWHAAFSMALFITVALAVVMVFITYETRSMGDRFHRRWWLLLALTAVLAFLATFAWLASTPVHTAGCDFGTVETTIPGSVALSRASVALVQGAIFFVIVSWMLTLVGKATKRATWYNNSQFGSLFRF